MSDYMNILLAPYALLLDSIYLISTVMNIIIFSYDSIIINTEKCPDIYKLN
jgi:hypothetical protein